MGETIKHEILIADDNTENLRFLNELLEAENYIVRVVKNGRLALESIKIRPPDLLIVDGHMPELDGFELCEILKGDPEYSQIPIIFLSALTDSFNIENAFKVGADDYLTKPFEIFTLKARVQMHLHVQELNKEIQSLNDTLAKKEEEIDRLKNS